MGLFQQQAYKAMQGSINLDLGPTREEEEERMQVKLTLREAQYLEEITAREPMLKEILAKIEEGADFQIVVSFRDKDED
jgi:HKD family nuclease